MNTRGGVQHANMNLKYETTNKLRNGWPWIWRNLPRFVWRWNRVPLWGRCKGYGTTPLLFSWETCKDANGFTLALPVLWLQRFIPQPTDYDPLAVHQWWGLKLWYIGVCKEDGKPWRVFFWWRPALTWRRRTWYEG